MSTDFAYPTEAEFRSMTKEEFRIFWRTFLALDPKIGVNVTKSDVDRMVNLKNRGWVPYLRAPLESPWHWHWRHPAAADTFRNLVRMDKASILCRDYSKHEPPAFEFLNQQPRRA